MKNITYKPTYINWTWTDPKDSDLAKVMVYVNNIFKINVSKGKQYHNSTGLLPNVIYRIGTHTVDTSGNINKTWVNRSAKTAKDNTIPASITQLKNITYRPIYINWTWIDPLTFDFSYVKVYINNIFKSNVKKGKRYFNSTGLFPNRTYRISTHTVDTSGNVNKTWVNKTARTAYMKDKFGIIQLYPSVSGGREWFSKWDNGHNRTWCQGSYCSSGIPENDPDDNEFWTEGKGDALYKTSGNGILRIKGSVPRMHILYTYTNESHYGYWHNVEITMYGKRISDSGIAYAGIIATARTNHMIDSDLCDTRGYYGQFRYDGYINFEKETAHGSGYAQVAWKKYWNGGMPYNKWIGYKYIVYDLPNGNVKLELYIDNTDGLNGGNWQKVNEFIDDGTNFGVGEPSCKAGIYPAMKLTSSDIRPGSESGQPNLDVYFRSDGVGTDGLLYKKVSIREIKN